MYHNFINKHPRCYNFTINTKVTSTLIKQATIITIFFNK